MTELMHGAKQIAVKTHFPTNSNSITLQITHETFGPDERDSPKHD